MCLQVQKLKHAEDSSEAVENLIGGGPGRWCVLRMHVGVHGEQAEKTIVMGTVFEHVGEWHGRAGEFMYEGSLQLSLHIMQYHHEDAKLLIQS